MTEGETGREEAIEALLAVLDDPEWGKQRLPQLVGYLDHEDSDVRAGAGWAITMVADRHEDTAEYLARRLGDRLYDEDASEAVERTLNTVAVSHPDVVEEELASIADERDDRGDARPYGGSTSRSNYAGGGYAGRGIGRTRLPLGHDSDDPRQVYTGEDEGQRQYGRMAPGEEEEEEGYTGPPGRELWARTDYLPRIAERSRFEDLTITAERRRGRYGDRYRTRATIAGEDLPVELVLFHRPEQGEEFGAGLDSALTQWNAVDDNDTVLTIHDWGLSPRPWMLTEYAAESVRTGEELGFGDALDQAQALASALGYVHERGVVHAGIDPGNVVYYGNLLDESERLAPLFSNVAVMTAIREYMDPTGRVDPRYAAPEYYDRSHGTIDHATDIYQLGAVLYGLFTNRHPYSGEYESIRSSILEGPPPHPSDVTDVPPAIDDVVTKAMAVQKLRRYESVTHLAADLRAIGADDAG